MGSEVSLIGRDTYRSMSTVGTAPSSMAWRVLALLGSAAGGQHDEAKPFRVRNVGVAGHANASECTAEAVSTWDEWRDRNHWERLWHSYAARGETWPAGHASRRDPAGARAP